MIVRRFFNAPAAYRDPFAELERMRREMDALSGNLFRQAGSPGFSAGVFPAINLTEDKDNFYVRAELPGVSADALDIQATGKTIAISGERTIAPESQTAKYHRREREAGRFSRIIELPGDIDADKVSAGLANGILTITIPKAEDAKPRQITIK
jgi:HSP20 family protein